MGDATVDAILQVYAHVRSDDTLQASEGITRLMSKFRICSILRITNNSRLKSNSNGNVALLPLQGRRREKTWATVFHLLPICFAFALSEKGATSS